MLDNDINNWIHHYAYKIAVGSSITFVDFIWSTYKSQNLEKLEG